jgi:microsomal dipeptidase-like Zn-dependent dipeptidase
VSVVDEDESVRESSADLIHAFRLCFGTRVTIASTVEDVADHIDYAVKIAGIDHVGIGSDFRWSLRATEWPG